MSSTTQDVAVRRFDDDILRSIRSFDDALAAAAQVDGKIELIDQTELSTGFEVLTDKARLVGVQLVILDWRFSQGDKGEFASIVVVTKQGEKLILNDGSTGIRDQLHKLGQPRAIGLRHGLRVSEYDYTDKATGEISRAKTFYLDTSA